MLRIIRVILACLSLAAVTLLFLDFTGTAHAWLGWMAKIQLLPALLAVNVGVVVALVAVTLLLGRVYCSVVCPLGVMQDVFTWLGGRGKKQRRFRFSYSKEKRWLRVGMLALFVVALVAGVHVIVALLAPYSAYGRIASNLLAPLYRWGNNGLAYLAERADSYAFYETDVWMKGLAPLVVAGVTLVVLAVLAWRNGRTYCNTICPVGTVLGYISRYAVMRPTIDTDKCNGCKLCSRQCKAACINAEEHSIDYSRCVACMDCIGACRQGAITYTNRLGTRNILKAKARQARQTDQGRRAFVTATAAVATASVVKAQEKTVDGGLAAIEDKLIPERETRLTPPGSLSARHFAQHCTACQLCVSACPNGVLRPSGEWLTVMQPEMSYERGYCRPECTRCSQVCPTGAIKPIDRAEKSAIQIGHAVWVRKNCVPLTDGVECGNCARHCPAGAISMVPSDPGDELSLKIPVVDTERCTGCGACENLCPARPFSAIYVEGHSVHRTI